MARKLASDKILFAALVALSLFGCVMIYSASAVSAGETSGNPYRYLLKQMAALVIGGVAAFVVYRTDYRRFGRPVFVYGFYGLTLALAGFALLRPPINGARRWIPLGFTMLQPSELLKVALVLLLAHQLARRAEISGGPEKALIPALVFSGMAAGVVILQPDLGTAFCYAVLCAVLLWLAGARLRIFVFGLLAAVPLLAALLLSADYRRARLLSFLNPEADPLGAGFQAIQSLIAVGAGGWFGKDRRGHNRNAGIHERNHLVFPALAQRAVGQHAVVAAATIADAARGRCHQQQDVHAVRIESFRKPRQIGSYPVDP